MTKDGIEYNLDITPYVYNEIYGTMLITYKFSSQLYLDKFLSFICNEYSYIKDDEKLYKKYGIKFSLKMIYDISYYSRLEKRGFQIVKNNEKKYNNKNELQITLDFGIM